MSAQRQVVRLLILIPSPDNTQHQPTRSPPKKESRPQSDGQLSFHFFTSTSLPHLREAVMNRCHFISWRKRRCGGIQRTFGKFWISLWICGDFVSIEVTLELFSSAFGWYRACTLSCVLTKVWKQVVWHLVDVLITSNKAHLFTSSLQSHGPH